MARPEIFVLLFTASKKAELWMALVIDRLKTVLITDNTVVSALNSVTRLTSPSTRTPAPSTTGRGLAICSRTVPAEGLVNRNERIKDSKWDALPARVYRRGHQACFRPLYLGSVRPFLPEKPSTTRPKVVDFQWRWWFSPWLNFGGSNGVYV